MILRGFCSRPKTLQSTQRKSDLTLLQVRATIVCLISMGKYLIDSVYFFNIYKRISYVYILAYFCCTLFPLQV